MSLNMSSEDPLVVTKYQLLSFNNGEPSRSYYFLNPGPGIYQIITDMGFSVFTPQNNLTSGYDDEKIHLISGNEIIDTYIFNTGSVNNEQIFTLTGEKSSLSFSTIDDDGKYYIYCPNLTFSESN